MIHSFRLFYNPTVLFIRFSHKSCITPQNHDFQIIINHLLTAIQTRLQYLARTKVFRSAT